MNVAAPALVFLLLAAGTLADIQKECTPGETKKMDCNTCFCTKAGIWGCTLMACNALKIDVTPGEQATRVRRSEGFCTPGATFKKDCNTCICYSDGSAALCTGDPCLSRNTSDVTPGAQATRVRRSEGHCAPGATFKKDCNTCTCNRDGTAAVCTLKACLSRNTREVSCTPGATYKEDCNTCRCRADGKSGACTRKACPGGAS